MALNIESKSMEYKNMQQTITSLQEESAMVDIVEAAQESVVQIIQEVAVRTQKCEVFSEQLRITSGCMYRTPYY